MADERDTNWLLRCPTCGEYVSVELEDPSEPGRIETARCASAHWFAFRHDEQTVEMRARISERR